MAARFGLVAVVALCLSLFVFPYTTTAMLKPNFYANTCPNVEKIVKSVVRRKINQTFVTIPATLRLFFHDCFPNGCDASILISSTSNNKAERDNPDNLSLAGDGFDVVNQAKEALDANPRCRNKVSCADILTIATRDVVVAAGGPFYPVELGRFDSLTSTAISINGKLPEPTEKVSTLLAKFNAKGLSLSDLVALSAAHTVGFSHCTRTFSRIYSFSRKSPVDPTLNKAYAKQLQQMCPKNVDPRIAIPMDPVTSTKFDNVYFKNLQQGKGLFTSDQDLFQDRRSRTIVNAWARDPKAFNRAFAIGMTKLGRIGVKTRRNGNIRRNCFAFN